MDILLFSQIVLSTFSIGMEGSEHSRKSPEPRNHPVHYVHIWRDVKSNKTEEEFRHERKPEHKIEQTLKC